MKSLTKCFLNKLLTDNDRKSLEPIIKQMELEIPEMMSRKIPEANVQQAFVFSTIKDFYSFGNRILSVGSFEDTACELLKHVGFGVEEVDPVLNYDLHTFKSMINRKYDIIFSTSVIEHVEDDEQFIQDMCDLLAPNGVSILTCDFKENYKYGDPLPHSNYRFYTKYDLNVRLRYFIENANCSFIEKTYWEGVPDFWYQGHNYSFASIVIQKDK